MAMGSSRSVITCGESGWREQQLWWWGYSSWASRVAYTRREGGVPLPPVEFNTLKSGGDSTGNISEA